MAVSHVIGKGGSTIKELKASTNTEISIIDGPKVKVEGERQMCEAVKKIKAILDEQANPDYEGPEGKRLRAEAMDSYGDQRTEKSESCRCCIRRWKERRGHALMKEAKGVG